MITKREMQDLVDKIEFIYQMHSVSSKEKDILYEVFATECAYEIQHKKGAFWKLINEGFSVSNLIVSEKDKITKKEMEIRYSFLNKILQKRNLTLKEIGFISIAMRTFAAYQIKNKVGDFWEFFQRKHIVINLITN